MRTLLPALACLAVLASSCSGDTSPGGVVRAYAAAIEANDLETAKMHVVASDRAALSVAKVPLPDPLRVAKESIEGEQAIVTLASNGLSSDIVLAREDGVWRIDIKQTVVRAIGNVTGVREALQSGDPKKAMDKVLEEAMKGLPGK